MPAVGPTPWRPGARYPALLIDPRRNLESPLSPASGRPKSLADLHGIMKHVIFCRGRLAQSVLAGRRQCMILLTC
eukprot:8400263-Pyramimonas_sp.AAC.1